MPTLEEMCSFSKNIEDLIADTGNELNHIEAIILYCEKTGLELDVAIELINPVLKSKLETDAFNQNLLKQKGGRLPI